MLRSRRFTGDLGGRYVATLYRGERPPSQTQKGWDVRMPTDDQRAQVKTQSFDSLNKWNYLDTDTTLFDRMILVVLTDALTIKTLYDVPSAELRRVLRVGKEQKPTYHFSDLEPWRTDVSTLSGFQRVAELVEREACRGARVWGRPSNMAVKLSVRPVTARAKSARSAPDRPAAYGRR